MTLTRRLILAFALMAGISPAIAQAPPPVPALPDTERRTTYSISASNCACNVNFALYGDSTDYQNWLEVFLNGVRVNYNDPTYGWAISSPTGPLSAIPRPVTDAVLTFTTTQTGTVQIVGALRPRRTSQFTENRGVAARDLNQALTYIIAQNREIWDKTNDMTGRGLFSQPGVTFGAMPTPASCASMFLGFDATGLKPTCSVLAIPLGSITNSLLAPMPAHTYKGNNTAGIGGPLDVTAAQLLSDLSSSGVVCSAVTGAGTCAVDPTQLVGNFGGRLTLVAGQGTMSSDVTSQNLYYSVDRGKVVPVRVSGTWGLYQFTSSSTDQTGLTLALAGSANWAADSIHDVFAVIDSGVLKLATRAWDSGMLPTVPQITNATPLTTGSTNAWTRTSAAFDGNLTKATAASAIVTSVSGLGQCIGQDWGLGNSKAISKVVITAPTDGFILGNQGPMEARLYGGTDNTNWFELSQNWFNDAAIGASYTLPINISNLQAYRYTRVCFSSAGAFIGSSVKLAQIQFYNNVAPAGGRRLAWVDGVPVNDAVMTGRLTSSTTISVPQYSGSLLGTIHIDAGANGSLTAHFDEGPARTFGVWNYWNRKHITLRANAPGTVTTPGSVSYTLTSQTFTSCNQGGGMSLQTVVGVADQPVNVTMKRVFTLNAQANPIGLNAGIAFDNTSAISGDMISSNLDVGGASGQVIGFNTPTFLTIPPDAGIHTMTCIEQVNNGGGTATVFSTNRLSTLRADWDG